MSTPLPEHIRAARALLNLSREDLSEISGVSRNTVARLENGESITLGKLNLLCDALKKHNIEFIYSEIDGYVGVKKYIGNKHS